MDFQWLENQSVVATTTSSSTTVNTPTVADGLASTQVEYSANVNGSPTTNSVFVDVYPAIKGTLESVGNIQQVNITSGANLSYAWFTSPDGVAWTPAGTTSTIEPSDTSIVFVKVDILDPSNQTLSLQAGVTITPTLTLPFYFDFGVNGPWGPTWGNGVGTAYINSNYPVTLFGLEYDSVPVNLNLTSADNTITFTQSSQSDASNQGSKLGTETLAYASDIIVSVGTNYDFNLDSIPVMPIVSEAISNKGCNYTFDNRDGLTATLPLTLKFGFNFGSVSLSKLDSSGNYSGSFVSWFGQQNTTNKLTLVLDFSYSPGLDTKYFTDSSFPVTGHVDGMNFMGFNQPNVTLAYSAAKNVVLCELSDYGITSYGSNYLNSVSGATTANGKIALTRGIYTYETWIYPQYIPTNLITSSISSGSRPKWNYFQAPMQAGKDLKITVDGGPVWARFYDKDGFQIELIMSQPLTHTYPNDSTNDQIAFQLGIGNTGYNITLEYL
jgi:hypothetical protein